MCILWRHLSRGWASSMLARGCHAICAMPQSANPSCRKPSILQCCPGAVYLGTGCASAEPCHPSAFCSMTPFFGSQDVGTAMGRPCGQGQGHLLCFNRPCSQAARTLVQAEGHFTSSVASYLLSFITRTSILWPCLAAMAAAHLCTHRCCQNAFA